MCTYSGNHQTELPGVNVKKNFLRSYVTPFHNKLERFVLGKPFQLGLMFAGLDTIVMEQHALKM